MRGNLRSSGSVARARTSRVARVHRTTTTATLLVTVAVSVLTGCTTVPGPTPAGPAAGGARSSAPRPGGPAEPRAVQAPAREALEMIAPDPTPDHPSGTPRPTPPTAAPSPAEPPPTDTRPAPARPRAHPETPERTRERRRPKPPEAPRTTGGGTGGNADVCSLGKRYGGWHPGSPESRICEQAYGH